MQTRDLSLFQLVFLKYFACLPCVHAVRAEVLCCETDNRDCRRVQRLRTGVDVAHAPVACLPSCKSAYHAFSSHVDFMSCMRACLLLCSACTCGPYLYLCLYLSSYHAPVPGHVRICHVPVPARSCTCVLYMYLCLCLCPVPVLLDMYLCLVPVLIPCTCTGACALWLYLSYRVLLLVTVPVPVPAPVAVPVPVPGYTMHLYTCCCTLYLYMYMYLVPVHVPAPAPVYAMHLCLLLCSAPYIPCICVSTSAVHMYV